MKKRVIIMGAAGRDFHNFNTVFRDNKDYDVVAFTATQIPNIEGRKYPAELAGKLYPKGIKIYPEKNLVKLIKKYKVDEVVFSYSDVSNEYVMQRSELVNAAGAEFVLLGPKQTMIKSKKPVIAICAVRTGCGKSQTSRKICQLLIKKGKKAVAVRHPMPYGNLVKQKCQRFETFKDLKKHNCTIEEMEEYEPYIEHGMVVYAGVDYALILKKAEKEADIILWDGGNNDLPFYTPDLHIVIADPLRPGDEIHYYPGMANLVMADVIIINKEDSAEKENIELVKEDIKKYNPKAIIINAESPITVDNPKLIKGKRVLVVEDGPTLTHGDMKYGAGTIAARKYGAKKIIEPRLSAIGLIRETYKKYPNIGKLLPAMGYSKEQIKDLKKTIDKADCDSVIIGTPIDLNRVAKFSKPSTRVRYELKEISKPDLKDVLKKFLK